MKKIFYLFLALFFAACQAEPEIAEEITPLVNTRASSLHISRTDNLNLNDLGIINPTRIVRKDSLYVILTPSSKYRFVIYNHHTGNLKRLVPAGRGANEGMYYLNLNQNGNIISSLDFGTGRLVEIDLTQYAQPDYVPMFTDLFIGGEKPLGAIRAGNQFISTGIYTQGRYRTTDPVSKTDNFSVAYPECADPTLNDTLKAVFYASNCLAVNQSNTRIACANMQYGCLDICNIEGNRLTRINEVHLNRPGVVFQHKRPRGRGMWYPVAYTRNNLFGFCDLTTSENHIFALYSGRTYREYKGNVDKGNIILVFDWNGTHIRTYHLPESCSSISYDKVTNTIYGLAHQNTQAEIITVNLD